MLSACVILSTYYNNNFIVGFLLLWQNKQGKQDRERNIDLAHGFRIFGPKPPDSNTSVCVWQNIIQLGSWAEEAL